MASPSIFAFRLCARPRRRARSGLLWTDHVPRAAGMKNLARDKGQFVIFLQKDHDAVLKLDALGCWGLKGGAPE